MTAVHKVAIAGAGVAGLAAAIFLAREGVEVDVYDAQPALPTRGSGITLQGNALRVLDELGVWGAVASVSKSFEGLTLRAPGPGALVVAALPDIKTGGPDYPSAIGMSRPDLARILLGAAESHGARAHFGHRITGLTQNEEGVELVVDGKSVGAFDLLVGADGLHSAVREMIGIRVSPEQTGMGIWRAFVSLPPEVERTELYYGGPMYIAGYTPTGDDAMYAFLVEAAQDRSQVSPEEARRIMVEQSRAYDGPWNHIRADIEAGAAANYTWFTRHLVEAPWNRGRVVVIGDAAHSCPPTIAQGAAQGLEDAAVLSELLVGRDEVDQQLWDAFHARRVERAKAIVDASVQLGQWQLDGVRDADMNGLIFGVAQLTAVRA
ncbi:FAD-dependent monooxygenase [Microbacterium binotii]|uniref:FAD-dependent monooxygenase n=1 Tax=Microbacterium binotii TaxID=462710 RepID=UPI001F35CB23|nr:FAD-dependent monooxygenase [Microbacterium binotii]UIN30985.1 FAD-dependent monooxygenase [Microbacterium binotii]